VWLYSHQFRTQCDSDRMGLHEYREGTDYVAQRVQCGPNFPAPINVTSQCGRIDPSKVPYVRSHISVTDAPIFPAINDPGCGQFGTGCNCLDRGLIGQRIPKSAPSVGIPDTKWSSSLLYVVVIVAGRCTSRGSHGSGPFRV
jgi:hypothetical protein